MKRAILPISQELLTLMLNGIQGKYGSMYEIIRDGLPEDTKLVDAFLKSNVIYVVVESEDLNSDELDDPLLLLDCPMY